MGLSWVSVLSLAGWSFWRILQKPAPGPAQAEPVRVEESAER
jgi:hypothetical protein